uniref:Uncharacterized protein n=1 Tax=Anguilla anguilla TaxID=7936 RepID=A0A0E9W878_ANGAN
MLCWCSFIPFLQLNVRVERAHGERHLGFSGLAVGPNIHVDFISLLSSFPPLAGTVVHYNDYQHSQGNVSNDDAGHGGRFDFVAVIRPMVFCG